MIDDEIAAAAVPPPAAALIGRGRRPCTSNPQENLTWSKALELKLVFGYLSSSPVCARFLLAKLLLSIRVLALSPKEGAHVTRSFGSTQGGR